jgi:KDO2-lipid IV(A) lauroyltransferase
VAFCAVALGICSDYGVVVYHYLINGGDRTDAAWRTLRRSVLYCVLTTVAGLGALAASALPGLRQFAVLIAVCLLVVAGLAVGPWARWVQRRITPRPPAPEPPPDRQTLPKAWQRAGWVYLVAGWALLAWAALHADRLYDFSWARLSPNNLEAQRGQAVLDAYVPGQFVTGDASNWAANRAVWRAHIPLALAPVFTQEDFQPALAQPYENLFHLLDRWSRGDRELEIWARGSTAFARLRAELPAMMRNNLVKVSAWSVMVILLLLGWGVGSVPMVLRTLLALAAGVGWWLAGLAALGEPLTLATLACLPIWFGLSEDFSIFLVLFLRAEGPQWGTARRRLGTPLALCAVTTVIGFGISGFSTQPVLRNFGVVLALGIASTFLAACVGLPALLVGTVPRPSHVSTFYTTFWFSLAERVAALTPRRVAQRVADWMGRAYALTHPGQSRIVRKNLRLLTGREPVPGAAANVCAHFARNLADYFYLGTRPLAAGVSLFVERRGYENLCRARAAGRGALLLTCHYGFFEGGGALMKQFDFPTVSLTAPEPSPSLTRWRARFRQRWGLDTLEIEPDPFFVLRLVEHLRENRFVAALIDRPFGPGFVEVQMPGGKLRVAGHIVLAAQAVRAPVLPMLIARRPDNLYRVWAGEPMEIEDQGGREATARYYAQRIMDCLQPELAQDAAQWTQFVSLSSPPS